MRLWTRILVAAAVCCAAALIVTPRSDVQRWTNSARTAITRVFPNRNHPPVTISVLPMGQKNPQHLTVMAVGGSGAQGYDDPHLDGYLKRALSQVSSTLSIPITFVNKAKSGQIPTMLAPQYDPLLNTIHPNIVIINWGLLNSISQKVPKSMFYQVIQSEVKMALNEGADVWIVTPPVTPATYVGHDVEPLKQYAALEIAAARSVHSTQVHIFDLMNAMKQYLAEHHESYKPYESNNWHMNQAGHILGGHILANAIIKRANSIGL